MTCAIQALALRAAKAVLDCSRPSNDSCHPGTHPAGSLRLSKIAPCNLVTRDFLSRALRATFGRPNSFHTNLSHKIAGAYFEQLQLACVVSELQGCSEY